MTSRHRRFELHRDEDVTDLSGTGVVADGVQFNAETEVVYPDGLTVQLPAGWCRVHWRGKHRSTVHWPSIEDAIAIHGHGGKTRLVWVDEDPADGDGAA